MDAAQMLHTFARRTCISRHSYWSTVYGALANDGRDRDGFDYTDEAYAVFPRYNVLQTILDRIEALNADALPPFDELRALLIEAAKTASSDATTPMDNPTHQESMAAERQVLAQAFRDVGMTELVAVEPLFYRRTLRSEEVKSWRRVIESAWGINAGYWFPLGDKTHPSLVALELYGIDDTVLQVSLRRFFAENSIGRVIELREYGESYEQQADAVDLIYNGAEGFWTTQDNKWIVYCSHEGTMTLGGKIAADVGPEFQASRYDPSQPPHWLASRQ